ncbi:MAG: nucleoside hydrolase [Promethearchaeota archaeon]
MIEIHEIIIDTDPGVDDALALMLAIKSGIFEIHAITTVAGNTTIENATRNARFILNLLKREDIPVYSGAVKPLERDLIQSIVHGKSGIGDLRPQNEANLTHDAVENILSIIEKNPQEITLVTIGPLTNVAKAIMENSTIMSKLKEIVIMGGAIKVPGNANRVAEFNIFVDPEAADIVFRFPMKKTLVPLDACNRVKMSMSDFESIKNPSLREPIISMMHTYIQKTFERLEIKAAFMYDPVTVYSLINPSACKKKEYNVLVETRGELTRGMTVAELRKVKREPPNVTVIETISEKEFIEDFITYLSL